VSAAAPAYAAKAPYTAAAVYDWTGFYVGISGGGSWGHVPWPSDADGTSGTASVLSALVAATWSGNLVAATDMGCDTACNGAETGAVHIGLNENVFRVGLNDKLGSR
jgi:hypothetical protein